MKIYGKPKKVLAVVAVTALPFLLNTAVSAQSGQLDTKRAIQAAGYVGKLSKGAIAAGMRERLQSTDAYDDMERNTGLFHADLRTRIDFWHKIALDSVALDHTPDDDGNVPFQQGGPTRTSRALAMTQIAVFEAVNAIGQEFESYTGFTVDDPGDNPDDDPGNGTCEIEESLTFISATDDGQAHQHHRPEKTIDGNFDRYSRWSNEGLPKILLLDLGTLQTLTSIDIAWYRGDRRKASFSVESSADGEEFEVIVPNRQSSGTTLDLQPNAVDNINAQFVRVVGNGNEFNDWNSIIEVAAMGCNVSDGGFGGTGSSVSSSLDAAVAQAAHDTLAALYTEQQDRLATILHEDLQIVRDHQHDSDVEDGLLLGARASTAIISNRANDRSNDPEPSFGEGGRVATGNTTFNGPPVNGGTTGIGEWTPDPNTPLFSGDFNLSLGAFWGGVKPFFLNSGDQFRAPAPPAVDSAEYAEAFAETAARGGAPTNILTESTSTDESRFTGNFWGYDAVPLIGVPPRMYNQIAAQVADEIIEDPVEYARYLAMVNTGMADVAIAAWDSKYFYNLWRPVTGIRRYDGNDTTSNDPTWHPVGVSVVNTQTAIRPTPPFPSYPSGHATFAAMLFELMRHFFDGEKAFTFVSDEMNGDGVDPFYPDRPRPLVPVRYETLTEAQLENGVSRIYNGVHWQFDNMMGQELGIKIAQFLLNDTPAFQRR